MAEAPAAGARAYQKRHKEGYVLAEMKHEISQRFTVRVTILRRQAARWHNPLGWYPYQKPSPLPADPYTPVELER